MQIHWVRESTAASGDPPPAPPGRHRVFGLPTRAGSRAVPDVPARPRGRAALRAAGAVIVGKLAMHELALGVTTPGVGVPGIGLQLIGRRAVDLDLLDVGERVEGAIAWRP
jgi:Asp-tRNA(Asn)/Glu-tRNA(Gln) amidotransferase A subunit family amidase